MRDTRPGPGPAAEKKKRTCSCRAVRADGEREGERWAGEDAAFAANDTCAHAHAHSRMCCTFACASLRADRRAPTKNTDYRGASSLRGSRGDWAMVVMYMLLVLAGWSACMSGT